MKRRLVGIAPLRNAPPSNIVIPTAVERARALISARVPGSPSRTGFARIGVGVGRRDLAFFRARNLRLYRSPFFTLFPIFALLALLGCGYHTAGHAVRLPATIHTIAVPIFINQTQTYRIEQLLTRDVVREFVERTHYQVVNDSGHTADAVLKGWVVSASAAPLTYDAQTGRISTATVTVSMRISLSDHQGRVFFENQNYTFRQQYQVSREVTSFFEEETPALQRMSQDFARTLVSDILEAF